MKADVAILVFAPLKARRKNNSFDGNDNVGVLVVKQALEDEGITVDYCAPETAYKYKVILVSLTSTYDVFAFYQVVALRPSWAEGKREFKVFVGGFGMQNPMTIRKYIDYAWFGRFENEAAKIIGGILGGAVVSHKSLMVLPDICDVVINQANTLLPFPIKLNKKNKSHQCNEWTEDFIGCPNKCMFCHYTWARKHIGVVDEYVQSTLTGGGTPEILWRDIPSIKEKPGRIRTAIDGFSERLRTGYGKRITDQDIIDGIEHLGSFSGNVVATVYNICNMPGETEDDRQQLYSIIRKAKPKNRVVFVLHSTPFRPSPVTPMSHCAASLFPAWQSKRGGSARIIESDKLLALHSRSMESPYSHLMSLVVERATIGSDGLFHAICFASKLQTGTSAQKIKRVMANFDTGQYLKEYVDYKAIPTAFLKSYIDDSKINIMRDKVNKVAA